VKTLTFKKRESEKCKIVRAIAIQSQEVEERAEEKKAEVKATKS
jgi:hypothetical protein